MGGDGNGVFDLDSRGTVTLTFTRMATAGPPAAQLNDALAGRAPAAAVLGDLTPSTRAALSPTSSTPHRVASGLSTLANQPESSNQVIPGASDGTSANCRTVANSRIPRCPAASEHPSR